MSKKPKNQCAHGNKAITLSGCFECVHTALSLLQVCKRLGCNGGELVGVLAKHYKNWGDLKDAVDAVKAENEAKEAADASKATEEAVKL